MSIAPDLLTDRFPKANAYHPEWVLGGASGGANPLWLAEWLCEELDLKPGMRVLDLGCGRGMSSIFLHREFGVQMWAADLWFSASENAQRVRDAGCQEGVVPIRADARALPFPEEFFDAVVSIDSFMFYGTDDLYLNYLARFLKPGGQLGIVLAGFQNEIHDSVPAHLTEWWAAEMPHCMHSPQWWRKHWECSHVVDVSLSDAMPNGWRYWLEWLKIIAPHNEVEIKSLEQDAGENFAYVRTISRRRAEILPFDPVLSIPPDYTCKPLLRSS